MPFVSLNECAFARANARSPTNLCGSVVALVRSDGLELDGLEYCGLELGSGGFELDGGGFGEFGLVPGFGPGLV